MRSIALWSLLVELDSSGELLKPALACGLVVQACSSLTALHATARAHGALSPSRLVVTPGGSVAIDYPGARVPANPMYSAPEQLVGGTVGPRTDVFALGLVLHDLVRGMRPMHDRIGALALTELTIDRLPLPVAEVLRGAIAIDPRARFATARELADALRDAGDAWGGSFDRADIAAWLAARQARRAVTANTEVATEPLRAARTDRLPAVFGISALAAFVAMVITAAIPTGMASVLARAQEATQRRYEPDHTARRRDPHAQARDHFGGLLQ